MEREKRGRERGREKEKRKKERKREKEKKRTQGGKEEEQQEQEEGITLNRTMRQCFTCVDKKKKKNGKRIIPV
jgi:hypothetical protein